MKLNKIYFLTLLPFLAFLTTSQINRDKRISKFDVLSKAFKSPGKEFKSAPLWVWNDKVTKVTIDSMLKDYAGNGFGGVIIHPRPGLITEYLSKDWFELFRYAKDEAKKRNLDIWIYDENSYPTGFGGGLVADKMPEAVNQGQMLYMETVSRLPDTASRYFKVLLATKNGFSDITSEVVKYLNIDGNFKLIKKENYKKSNRGTVAGPLGVSYVDLMVKGVTQTFIDVTFKGYERVAGADFGKSVKGVFSDEPSVISEGKTSVRWSPDLFAKFQEKWGYSLESNLPSLFEETGNWKMVRHNYFQVLLQLFIDRWSKPMHAYMESKNLIWTGHYWEHGWPSPYHGPDNMAMYAWHQMPGIDMLFNQFSEENPVQFGNIRAVKELGSVANQLNKKRTLSETYGGGGWELTFKDMKRLADWQFVLGVNFLNQHLSFMTIKGSRKYDYPPSFSYHEPWWPQYKSLNEYYARLALSLSSGEEKNDILILEPTTTAWMYYYGPKVNPRFHQVKKQFNDFVTKMQKEHYEYDLGSENIIKDHGTIKNGKFIIGQRAYSTVITPPGMENLDGATFELLQKFINQGGKVVVMDSLKFIDGNTNLKLENLINASKNILKTSSIDDNVAFKKLLPKDFKINGNGGNLYYQRRKLTDGELLFVSNASMTEKVNGSFDTNGKDILLMDLFTGQITNYVKKIEGTKVSAKFELPTAGSMMFFIPTKKVEGFKSNVINLAKEEIPSGASKVVRPIQNSLMIDFCDLDLYKPDLSLKEKHVGVASNTAFKHFGFKDGVGNPWNNRTQYKQDIVVRDTFQRGTGYTASYHFYVEEGVDYSSLRAVAERPELWSSVKINGKTITPTPGKWWLDRSFGVYDISGAIKVGKNTFSVTVSPMSVFAEIEPVYILGNFNLKSAPKGFELTVPHSIKLGPWNNQGLPMYAGTINYFKSFINNTKKNEEVFVHLDKWNGTVASVKVNGKDVGILYSNDQDLKITNFLKQGKNLVVVGVVGSLKNLLGPHHKNPKPGLVDPGKWYGINKYPAGKDYETYPYGLDDDFTIIRSSAIK